MKLVILYTKRSFLFSTGSGIHGKLHIQQPFHLFITLWPAKGYRNSHIFCLNYLKSISASIQNLPFSNVSLLFSSPIRNFCSSSCLSLSFQRKRQSSVNWSGHIRSQLKLQLRFLLRIILIRYSAKIITTTKVVVCTAPKRGEYRLTH